MAKVLFVVYVPDEDDEKKRKVKKEAAGGEDKGTADNQSVEPSQHVGGSVNGDEKTNREDFRTGTEEEGFVNPGKDGTSLNGVSDGNQPTKDDPNTEASSDTCPTPSFTQSPEKHGSQQTPCQPFCTAVVQSVSSQPSGCSEASQTSTSSGPSPSADGGEGAETEDAAESRLDDGLGDSTQGESGSMAGETDQEGSVAGETDQEGSVAGETDQEGPFLLSKATIGQELKDDFWDFDVETDTQEPRGQESRERSEQLSGEETTAKPQQPQPQRDEQEEEEQPETCVDEQKMTLEHRQDPPKQPVHDQHRQDPSKQPVHDQHRQDPPKQPVHDQHRQDPPKQPVHDQGDYVKPDGEESKPLPISTESSVHVQVSVPRPLDASSNQQGIESVPSECAASPHNSALHEDGEQQLSPSTADQQLFPSTADQQLSPSTADQQLSPSTADQQLSPSTADPAASTDNQVDKQNSTHNQEDKTRSPVPSPDQPDAICDNSSEDNLVEEDLLTPLVQMMSSKEEVENVLCESGVKTVTWQKCHNASARVWQAVFVADSGVKCEKLLKKLQDLGVGKVEQSSVSVLPITVHSELSATPEKEEEPAASNIEEESSPDDSKLEKVVDEKEDNVWTVFQESIKSRLLVAQVVESVETNARFTFDYLMLIVLASMIAALGLVENSSVVLVASMLVSPLMGPILAGTFGTVIKNNDLRNLGIRSEIIGLTICIVSGFVLGLIPAALDASGAGWRSVEEWPTLEMTSRGVARGLVVGVLIALPSGMGVALSVLGGNAGSLVGVAISASLLPPAVNAGMLWSNALIVAAFPPSHVTQVHQKNSSVYSNASTSSFTDVNYTTTADVTYTTAIINEGGCPQIVNNDYVHTYTCNTAADSLALGAISLLLTMLNISCIFITGILILKVKEVAPNTSSSQSTKAFFGHDIKVARESYTTTKGRKSHQLGKQFLEEYRALKLKQAGGTIEEESEAVLEFEEMLQDVEDSSHVQEITRRLPNAPRHTRMSEYMEPVFERAARDHMQKHPDDVYVTRSPRPMTSSPLQFRRQPSFHNSAPAPSGDIINPQLRPLAPVVEGPTLHKSQRHRPMLRLHMPRQFQVTKIADKNREKARKVSFVPRPLGLDSGSSQAEENVPLLDVSGTCGQPEGSAGTSSARV